MYKNKSVYSAIILVIASMACAIVLAGCGGGGGGGGASASPVGLASSVTEDTIGNGGSTAITADATGITNPASAAISIDWAYSINGVSHTEHVVTDQPMLPAGTGRYQYSYTYSAGRSTNSSGARLYDTYTVRVTVADGIGKTYTNTTTFRVQGPLKPPDPFSKTKGSTL